MTSVPDLRPLSMGELLDRTAALWRLHMWPLFGLTFALQLVTWAVGKYYTVELAQLLQVLTETGGNDDPLAGMGSLARVLGLAMAVMIVYWWMSNAASLACAHYMLSRTTGRPTTMGDAVRRLMKRFGALSGVLAISIFYAFGYQAVALIPAMILAGIAVIVVAVAGGSAGWAAVAAIPAVILVFFGMAAATLWYLVRVMIAAQVLAAEELGVFGALRRSGELLSGRLGAGFIHIVKIRATIVVSVMWILVLAISTTAQIPVFILQAIYRTEGDPFGLNLALGPKIAMTCAEVIGVAAQALFSPLSIVLATLFYVDMRVRREGWDLELKLDAGKA